MKLLLLTATLLLSALSLHAQGIAQPRPLALPADVDVSVLKDTGKMAIADVLAAFAANEAAGGGKSYIILPLGKDIDNGYFTLQFENAFTQKAKSVGYKLYTRTDKVLEKVLTEVEFQQNFGDSIDKATMQKLALVGAEAVVLPRIDIDKSVSGAITLRATISVHNVASGEKTWGDEATRIIPGKLTTDDWVRYGAYGLAILGVLIILIWILRSVRAAARPR